MMVSRFELSSGISDEFLKMAISLITTKKGLVFCFLFPDNSLFFSCDNAS